MTTVRDEFKSWVRQNLPHVYLFMDFTQAADCAALIKIAKEEQS